jgi:hypothetical protein
VAKVKQPYDETRYVPWVGRDVAPGEVVTVPDDDLASYVEAGWEAVAEPARATRVKES